VTVVEYRDTPLELLAALGSVSTHQRAAERLASDLRNTRDRLVIELARLAVPFKDIAAATGTTPQAVGKLARAAGIRRYRSPSVPAERSQQAV
jgi:hypothetical protein